MRGTALQDLRVCRVPILYDLQYGTNHFLPASVRRFIPDRLGSFLVVQGWKVLWITVSANRQA